MFLPSVKYPNLGEYCDNESVASLERNGFKDVRSFDYGFARTKALEMILKDETSGLNWKLACYSKGKSVGYKELTAREIKQILL